jgi:hypothetical protein
VQAQRVALTTGIIKEYSDILSYRMRECAGNPSNKICSNDQKFSLDAAESLKQISELQADYFANLMLASLYLCEKTRSSISEMQNSAKNWWEVDEKLRSEFVRAMVSEVTCNLDVRKIFQ